MDFPSYFDCLFEFHLQKYLMQQVSDYGLSHYPVRTCLYQLLILFRFNEWTNHWLEES